MSLATLGRAPLAPLPELVDGLAQRSGAWVVVEQLGRVLAHGAGSAACPPALAATLVSKRTADLRAAVAWVRGSRLRGHLDGLDVSAAELGGGTTAWFLGGAVHDGDVRLLAAAAADGGTPPTDPVVEELLHPRGPSRAGRAPAARLVVLQDAALGALGRTALSAVAGTDARVHTEHDRVVVALPPEADARHLVRVVRVRCPGAVAGTADVPQGAANWSATAAVATACARTAATLGAELAQADDPAVGAELVVDEALEAARLLTNHLPHPLARLQAHDDRTGGELLPTLRAWCRAGFEVATTAADLHVHTNTLRYRLRRAAEISGLDLDRPRHVMALQLLLAV